MMSSWWQRCQGSEVRLSPAGQKRPPSDPSYSCSPCTGLYGCSPYRSHSSRPYIRCSPQNETPDSPQPRTQDCSLPAALIYFTASPSGTGSEEIILKITRTECLQSCVLSRYRTPCIGFCLEEFWIRACYEKAISCASRGAGRWVTRFRKSILSCLQIPLALPGGG